MTYREATGSVRFSHAKYRKTEVGFEHPAKGKDHCGLCVHFEPEDEACEIVKGVIQAGDWCEKFLRRKHGKTDH